MAVLLMLMLFEDVRQQHGIDHVHHVVGAM